MARRRQARATPEIATIGTGENKREVALIPVGINPLLKLLMIGFIGLLTFANVVLLTGMWTVQGDMWDGGLRAICLLSGPLAILLLLIADRQT